MKRIEAIIGLSALADFHRCAKDLGIYGFDLSVRRTRLRDRQILPAIGVALPVTVSSIKVDFAVLDEQTKPTVHALLKAVHPKSIGIFKFDEDEDKGGTVRSRPNPT